MGVKGPKVTHGPRSRAPKSEASTLTAHTLPSQPSIMCVRMCACVSVYLCVISCINIHPHPAVDIHPYTAVSSVLIRFLIDAEIPLRDYKSHLGLKSHLESHLDLKSHLDQRLQYCCIMKILSSRPQVSFSPETSILL